MAVDHARSTRARSSDAAGKRVRRWVLDLLARAIRRRFRRVHAVSPDALARQLASEPCDRVQLLDVRTAEEFAVSHLPGARRLDPAASDPALLRELPATRPAGARVVVYCAVGYRSARMAERMRAAGLDDVVNLEGGIFRWANEGRPLVRGLDPAHAVHPYGPAWGWLLEPELRGPGEESRNPPAEP